MQTNAKIFFSTNNLIYLFCILFNVVLFKRGYFHFSFDHKSTCWNLSGPGMSFAVFVSKKLKSLMYKTKIFMNLKRILNMKSDFKIKFTFVVPIFPLSILFADVKATDFVLYIFLSLVFPPLSGNQLSSAQDPDQQ